MQIEKLVYREYIHGKQFPVDTIILRLNNKTEIACSNFRFIISKWKREFSKNKYTKIIYDIYKDKCKSTTVDCSKLMKYDRVHKKGSGGKISPTYIVTDYECRKVPLHDFQRYYI